MKGFISGYFKGMYKKTNFIQPVECLGDKMFDDVMDIYEDLSEGKN